MHNTYANEGVLKIDLQKYHCGYNKYLIKLASVKEQKRLQMIVKKTQQKQISSKTFYFSIKCSCYFFNGKWFQIMSHFLLKTDKKLTYINCNNTLGQTISY